MKIPFEEKDFEQSNAIKTFNSMDSYKHRNSVKL